VVEILSAQKWRRVAIQESPEAVRTISGALANVFHVMRDEAGREVFMAVADAELFAPDCRADSRELPERTLHGKVGDELNELRNAVARGGRMPEVNLRSLPPRHFAHLGPTYFRTVFGECRRARFWPLRYIYTGKKGEEYSLIHEGRNINPNWMAEDNDGRRISYLRGHRINYEFHLHHVIRHTYDEIADFFDMR
jgi:hypothetical protein